MSGAGALPSATRCGAGRLSGIETFLPSLVDMRLPNSPLPRRTRGHTKPGGYRWRAKGKAMIDRYTKTVLTVIAAALVVLVLQNLAAVAVAQNPPQCGFNPRFACFVATDPSQPLAVK